MKLKDLSTAVGNAQLIDIFKIAVKRAALTIIADPQSTEPLIAWAKRARLTFKDDRSDFYATLILEGALNESEEFRDAVEAAMTNNAAPSLPDEAFVALVTTWVTRFAALGI